jgi:hypothetical protein
VVLRVDDDRARRRRRGDLPWGVGTRHRWQIWTPGTANWLGT